MAALIQEIEIYRTLDDGLITRPSNASAWVCITFSVDSNHDNVQR